MAKMDVRQAYRNILVHPTDRLLLEMKWVGRIYVDVTFPVGLRSAPVIFTAIADTLQWIMWYVDNFIMLRLKGVR